MGTLLLVKTTIELPDTLFRSAKACAAKEGVSLRIFFERAVVSQLQRQPQLQTLPTWHRSFGKLKNIKAATREVQQVVDREFSRIEDESWR